MSHSTASQIIPRQHLNISAVLPTVHVKDDPKSTMQIFPFLSLLLLQLIDAFLTLVGIENFGPSMEGNPILRTYFSSHGVLPTLISAKLMASVFICVLFVIQTRVKWVPRAIWGLTGVYVLSAVIPWGMILY